MCVLCMCSPFRGGSREAGVVAEKVRQVLGKGKMKLDEWRKERENKRILNSCRTEELEHLEDTEMRRSSAQREHDLSRKTLDGDECHTLCVSSAVEGKKPRAFS